MAGNEPDDELSVEFPDDDVGAQVPDDLSALFAESSAGDDKAGDDKAGDDKAGDDKAGDDKAGDDDNSAGRPRPAAQRRTRHDPDDDTREYGFDVAGVDLTDVRTVLDDAELVRARDPGRLLWALATAGAQVRRSTATAAERTRTGAGLQQMPRAVLVATDPSARVAGAVLAHLGGDRAAVLDWRTAELPGWAGPADVLLAASVDGRHPRVAMLLAEADRRGLTVVAVSPEDSPVAAAAGRGQRMAIEPPAHRRAALWTMLTPLLLAARELGVVTVDEEELGHVADSLDAVAAACRPDHDAFDNAAKQLAEQVNESDLLVLGCGPLSALAGRWLVDSLGLMAGIGALALGLPDDLAQAGALLDIAPTGPATSAPDDFFRDRTEMPTRRRRLLILPEHGTGGDPDERWPRTSDPGRPGWAGVSTPDARERHDVAASRAADTLDDIAAARGIGSGRPELPGRSALAHFAAAAAFGDFTAAYAAIGRGVDPGAVRAGELPF